MAIRMLVYWTFSSNCEDNPSNPWDLGEAACLKEDGPVKSRTSATAPVGADKEHQEHLCQDEPVGLEGLLQGLVWNLEV